MRRATPVIAVLFLVAALPARGDETGTVKFTPAADQSNVPDRYRLTERTSEYQLQLKLDPPGTAAK